MKIFIPFFLAVAFHIQAVSAPVHPWEVSTLTFTAGNTYSNPYGAIPVNGSNDLLAVTFTGISGEAEGKIITLLGCWNGGKEWIVNFASPCTGKWRYKSVSADSRMNGKKGMMEVIPWTQEDLRSNPVRRGFVRVHKGDDRAGRYFEYADGTPFLWVGDTWWNWTKRSIHFETYATLVDDRAAKGFNVGQLFVPGNGWGSEGSALDTTYSVLDPKHIQHVERMIRYANDQGITVWIHGWWSRRNLDQTVGEEKMRRWWRYLVHRFAAYNVIWVLAGEYNMFNNGGFTLSFWNNLGEMIKKEDPYDRIVSTHNTPPFWDGGSDAPQWSTGSVFHQSPWLDYNQSQTGHGRYANEMIPAVVAEDYARIPPKPIVVTEPWYEFVEGNPTGRDVRLAAWGAILSGAAGHTYGGGHVWLASVPESPGGGGPWPLEEGFKRTTYDYEGAVSMGVLSQFFKEIQWWNLSPHPELIADYPQPFCLAIPGKEYLVYARYGGYLRVNLQSRDRFSYYWLDPRTGKKYRKQVMSGSDYAEFRAPESYPAVTELNDWVLYIRKDE
jgi:hypothetical protein